MLEVFVAIVAMAMNGWVGMKPQWFCRIFFWFFSQLIPRLSPGKKHITYLYSKRRGHHTSLIFLQFASWMQQSQDQTCLECWHEHFLLVKVATSTNLQISSQVCQCAFSLNAVWKPTSKSHVQLHIDNLESTTSKTWNSPINRVFTSTLSPHFSQH